MSGISKIITSIESEDDFEIPDIEQSEMPLSPQPDQIPRPSEKKPERLVTEPVERTRERLFTEPQLTENPDRSDFRWVGIFTLGGVLAWLVIAAFIALSVLKAAETWQNYTTLQWTGLALLFLAPIGMIGICAFALRQLAKLSSQARRLEYMAVKLSEPDEMAADKTRSLAQAVAQQMDIVNAKLNEAVGQTAAIEEIAKRQVQSIDASSRTATETVASIGKALDEQKNALTAISNTFDERLANLSSVLENHTDELAQATRQAEQKIREARISVEGATSKISNAADIVRTNTVEAASNLSASHEEISTLGDIIRQRSDELDEVYKRHANDLTSMIENLRDEQKNLGNNMETTLIKMRDLSLAAQSSAESLSDASNAGKQTVESLAKSANLADNAVKTRFAEMEQMVRYSTEHAQNISAMASQRVQDSLDHTRTEIARIERDMAELQIKLKTPSDGPGSELVPNNIERDAVLPHRNTSPRIHLKPVIEDNSIETVESAQAEEINDPPPEEKNQDNPLDLHLEPVDEKDLKRRSHETEQIIDAIRPVAEYKTEKKEKPGFSFKGLFRRNSSSAADSSLDIAAAPIPASPSDHPPQPGDPATSEITMVLSELGLAPNVIVDDGCVIEAANNRATNGHKSMSRSVIWRLSDPVRHLAQVMSTDSGLSEKSIAFATGYDKTIERVSGDREAIRTRLESEDGRAYLLCDAALNFGRV